MVAARANLGLEESAKKKFSRSSRTEYKGLGEGGSIWPCDDYALAADGRASIKTTGRGWRCGGRCRGLIRPRRACAPVLCADQQSTCSAVE